MPKLLHRTQFGNPVLRHVARTLTADEILSDDIQTLITDMRYTCKKKQYGVGLAAPQVGRDVAISILALKPTPTHTDRVTKELILINPEIVESYGKKTGMWEGCLSFGGTKQFPYAKTMRYKKLRVVYLDENAERHDEIVEGFLAHVVQHEVDHLNGILFVDRVVDNKSFMMASEFKKRILPNM